MPKTGKSDAECASEFVEIARDDRVDLRGKKYRGKNGKTYDKIFKCPVWKNMFKNTAGTQLTLFNQPSTVDECNCGYEKYHGKVAAVVVVERAENTPSPPMVAAATQQAPPPPPLMIPFNNIPEFDAFVDTTTRDDNGDVCIGLGICTGNKARFPFFYFRSSKIGNPIVKICSNLFKLKLSKDLCTYE